METGGFSESHLLNQNGESLAQCVGGERSLVWPVCDARSPNLITINLTDYLLLAYIHGGG
jgi:hypothetical protein